MPIYGLSPTLAQGARAPILAPPPHPIKVAAQHPPPSFTPAFHWKRRYSLLDFNFFSSFFFTLSLPFPCFGVSS